jgi:hypothetical protein
MLLLVITDLIADNATHRCTTDRSESAAACKNGTSDSTGTRTDRSVSITC